LGIAQGNYYLRLVLTSEQIFRDRNFQSAGDDSRVWTNQRGNMPKG
jgi:hypothetical protein